MLYKTKILNVLFLFLFTILFNIGCGGSDSGDDDMTLLTMLVLLSGNRSSSDSQTQCSSDSTKFTYSSSSSNTDHQAIVYDTISSGQVNACITGLDSKKTYNIFVVYSNLDTANSRKINEGSGTGKSESREIIERNVFINKIPDYVREFNKNPPVLTKASNSTNLNIKPPPINFYTVGTSTKTWKTSDNSTTSYDPVSTTLRGQTTLSSGKTLHVWIGNNEWTYSSIDYNDVSTIMNTFKSTIYDKAKKIAGNEWGTHGYSDLLSSSTSEIHIVLYDINGDGAYGTIGFFYNANNYLTSYVPYSNQALVFFIDSPTYIDSSSGSETVIGTLAHEFQHMIHYYQKNILKDASSNTWLNEMCSQVVEDSLAYYLGGFGTGPLYDRLPGYVANPNGNITDWNGNAFNYETAYSFGGYLLRNFGGADLFTSIIQSSGVGMDAIDSALSQSSFSDWKGNKAFMYWGASLAMNPSKGSLPKYFGYPATTVSGYFGSGSDLKLEAGNMYKDTKYQPKIYTTPPTTILTMSNVVYKI
ncbi:MAG: hypothetical protein H7A23_19140, partial [Leptospiraceae bacterium]|nr:hypothetical protein [Leptospiraceae bacterium]